MAKVSKSMRSKKKVRGKSLNKKLKRSRTMKKSKRGTSMKKIMEGSMKPRNVYCVACKKKVKVERYELKPTPKGAYQLIGDCVEKGHKLNKNNERKVYTFVSAKDV